MKRFMQKMFKIVIESLKLFSLFLYFIKTCEMFETALLYIYRLIYFSSGKLKIDEQAKSQHHVYSHRIILSVKFRLLPKTIFDSIKKQNPCLPEIRVRHWILPNFICKKLWPTEITELRKETPGKNYFFPSQFDVGLAIPAKIGLYVPDQ